MTTVVGTQRFSQIGGQFNQISFNGSDIFSYSNTFVSSSPSQRKRTQFGFGYFGARVYGRPYDYIPFQRNTGGTGVVTIEISSISGALIGKIRSDIQKPIIQSLEFTLNADGGCADFNLKLSSPPPFPIVYGSIIKVSIAESEFGWFMGQVLYPDDLGTQREYYEFRGNGLSRFFETAKGEGTYGANDIGEIILQIMQDNVFSETPINYNPAKFTAITGVVTSNSIQLGKYALSKVLDDLSAMAGCNYGVDGDGDFYLLPIDTDPSKTLFVGYDLQTFDPKSNVDNVKNTITVQRKEAVGAGGAGWVVAGVYNDASSVHKYGRKELNYQIPGYFGQEEADIIGNALLEQNKEPKLSANCTGIIIRNSDQYFNRGVIRVVNTPEQFDTVISDIDSAADFSKTGSGDSTVEDDSDIFMWADGGVRFTFTNALNDEWSEIFDIFMGRILSIRFWVRSNQPGSYLTFGVGESNWYEHTTKIDIPAIDLFYPIDWDVRSENIQKIGAFGFRIDSSMTEETFLWIDKLELTVKGHKHYEFPLMRSKYSIAPNDITVDLECGVLPPKMEDYLAGLFSEVGQSKYTAEIT
jgi:hypothetical protein